MKTAIEQLIEAFEVANPHTRKETIVMMRYFLEEEESQIKEAYNEWNYSNQTADEFFNEKYNK